jgi:hypothetical protein
MQRKYDPSAQTSEDIVIQDGLVAIIRESQLVSPVAATAMALFKTNLANPKIVIDANAKMIIFPSALYDVWNQTFFGVADPLPTIPPANGKYDSTSGTAAGSTATTATFLIANEIMITGFAVVTAGATTIVVKGTTSGRILATITLPTIAAATYLYPMVFFPSIALTGETVTLTLSANFTSGTVNVNVYGN